MQDVLRQGGKIRALPCQWDHAEGPNKRDASDLYDQPLDEEMGGINAMENH